MGRWALAVLLALIAGCGTRRIVTPTDPGAPFPDFAQVHDRQSAQCRGVRSLTAVLGLAGRAAGESLRGTVHAGFERPASMRLEHRIGPFGTLGFVLVAQDGQGTLWLPRDQRVVRNASATDIGAADLQAILTGCVLPSPIPVSGRRHGNGWVSVVLDGGATLYLEPQGNTWRLRAAERENVRVEYAEWPDSSAFPARIELRSEAPVQVELRLSVSQVETNVDLEAAAFTIEGIPAGTPVITVEELRANGPLRGDVEP